ncbi:MFS transporter [Roseomonas eburnea]|uniref:MFS transporter n=1 Tax=Neoroseomonas eburnea TaxID=1346889 RepID=A0A9X9X9Y1_9PROT|nr:MFS transporter [Neoroseomonas eburnea]MBR0680517.1 MFS transporter [Neoroseomonas eburnea]
MTGGFFGWRVVGAAFGLAVFAWGIGFYGPGVWLHALTTGRGWSVAIVSAAITLHFLASAAIVARLPALHARFGPVVVTRAGIVAAAAGAAGWACAPTPWLLLPPALLTAAGWAFTSGAAINALIAPWFDRRRPAALAMAYNGASVGGILVIPLWAALIGWLGFATAALTIGLAGIAVLWPVAGRYFRPDPARLGLHPDGAAAPPAPRPVARPAGPLWSQPAFRSLSLAFALGLVAQMGLLSQLFSLLAPELGAQGAGWALSLATACAVLGRTAVGWLLPPGADRRRAAVLNFLVQAAGSLVLLAAGGSAPFLLLACVLFGLGIGNLLSLPPLIAQAEWPPEELAAVVALITAVNQAFYAFAPALFGLLRDLAGDWTVGAAALALQFAAALILRTRT